MENLDIFKVNMEDFEVPSGSQNSSNEFLFKPDPKKAKDEVYSATVRLVYWLGNPNGFNPKHNYIEKKTFYLKNDKDEGGYFDSSFSIGEKCEAMDAFFKLKREGKDNQRSEELADEIKPKSSFFYLVYVEEDSITPENEGQLMVWKAPIQIHKLINSKVNPDKKQLERGKKPEDVFSPINGRSIDVTVSMNKWWDYSGCEWLDSGPMTFNGKEFTAKDKKSFVEFIEKGNELMEPYIFTPMSSDRKQLLLDIITEKTGITFGTNKVPPRGINISGMTPDEKEEPKTTKTPKAKKEPKADTVLEESKADKSDTDALKNARPSNDDTSDIDETDIDGFLDDLDLDLG